MKIRIYVMTHKKFEMPQSPLFRPLHVGRACGEALLALEFTPSQEVFVKCKRKFFL